MITIDQSVPLTSQWQTTDARSSKHLPSKFYSSPRPSLCIYHTSEGTQFYLLSTLCNRVFVPLYGQTRMCMYLHAGAPSNLIFCAESTDVSPGQGLRSNQLSTTSERRTQRLTFYVFVCMWEHTVKMQSCIRDMLSLLFLRKGEQTKWLEGLKVPNGNLFVRIVQAQLEESKTLVTEYHVPAV